MSMVKNRHQISAGGYTWLVHYFGVNIQSRCRRGRFLPHEPTWMAQTSMGHRGFGATQEEARRDLIININRSAPT